LQLGHLFQTGLKQQHAQAQARVPEPEAVQKERSWKQPLRWQIRMLAPAVKSPLVRAQSAGQGQSSPEELGQKPQEVVEEADLVQQQQRS
jgi:hypothetical protein